MRRGCSYGFPAQQGGFQQLRINRLGDEIIHSGLHAALTFFIYTLLGSLPLLFAILATTVGIIWWQDLGHPLETVFLSFLVGIMDLAREGRRAG